MGKIAILAIVIAVAIGAAVFVFSPSVNHYQVSVDIEGDGSVTGTGTYAEGSEVTLVAVDGSEGFFKWSDGSKDSTYTFTVNGDVHLTAYFGTYYTIDAVQTYSSGGSVTGGGDIRAGSQVTLTAVPDLGYEFSHWEEDGSIISYESTITFTAEEDRTVTPVFVKTKMVVTVTSNYDDAGATAFRDAYYLGEMMTLTAVENNGYRFEGWYSNGTLLSSSLTYGLEVTGDMEIEARYSIIHDASFTTDDELLSGSEIVFESTYTGGISQSSWTITDKLDDGKPSMTVMDGTDASLRIVTSEPVYAEVTRTVTYLDGHTESYSVDVVIDGTVTKTYTWRYQSESQYNSSGGTNDITGTVSLDMTFSWYLEYRTDDITRDDVSKVYDYVTDDDSVIKSLVSQLNTITAGMSDIVKANCVLKFVQSFAYVYDSDSRGEDEWYMYPAEILWEMSGDCEDHAILS